MTNPYIFISYAHADAGKVYGEFSLDKFTEDLLEAGFNLWVDSDNLSIGGVWDREIKQAIADSAIFFLVVTDNSASSTYIKRTELPEAQRTGKPIVPIIIHGDALSYFGNLGDVQGVKLASAYQSELAKLKADFAHLQVQQSQEPFTNILDRGTMQVNMAARTRRATLDFGSQYPYAGLLVNRSPYRMAAYLVAPENETLKRQSELNIFLQFSGEAKDRTFQEYLEYLSETGNEIWTLLVRGPYDNHIWEYTLDDEDTAMWQHAVEFIITSIHDVKGDTYYNFFLNTPNALTMAFTYSFRDLGKGRFHVYNYQRQARSKRKQYKLVYKNY